MGNCPNINFDKLDTTDKADAKAYSEALYEVGREIRFREFYNEAICYFDKSIEFNRENILAWNSKIDTLCVIGEYDKALECYNSVNEIYSKDLKKLTPTIELQEILLLKAKADDILKSIENLSVDAIYNRLEDTWNRGARDEARVYFKELYRLEPNNWRGVYLYWDKGQRKGGCFHGKVFYIDEILRVAPNDSTLHTVWLEKAEYLLANGLYDEAFKCYDKVLELSPEYLDEWKSITYNLCVELGAYLVFKGFYKQAIKHLDKAILLMSDNAKEQMEELTRFNAFELKKACLAKLQ